MTVNVVILEYRQFPGQRLSVSDVERQAGGSVTGRCCLGVMQSLAFLWRELKTAKRQLNEALTDGQESGQENLAVQKEVSPEPMKIATKEQVTDERIERCPNGKPRERSSPSEGCSWARV
jgi:hypothetical protein